MAFYDLTRWPVSVVMWYLHGDERSQGDTLTSFAPSNMSRVMQALGKAMWRVLLQAELEIKWLMPR